MRKTFRSAIGWIMIIPLVLLLVVAGFALYAEPKQWPAMLILIPVLLFIADLLIRTDYTIEGDQLRIRCGFFRYGPIDIASITCITETRNPLSSPALSLDRLHIRYGHRGQVMISPKDKAGFLAAIQRINPLVDHGNNRRVASTSESKS